MAPLHSKSLKEKLMLRKTLLLIGTMIIGLTSAASTTAQTTATKLYRQMSPSEQAAFVQDRARDIARQLSGSEYEFTPAFEMEIQKNIDKYGRRIGNNGERWGKGDLRAVFSRGSAFAPTLIAIFKTRE